jgi:hypothetical protein
MVQVVMSFLDDTPDMETKLRLIETLRTVTEGKVSHFQIWGAQAALADGSSRSLSRSNELA